MLIGGDRPRGRPMDIGDWLRSLGLGQYEDAFRKNEIDSIVLPDLTEGDFEKLGVPMGHRKRLVKAIASLGTSETAAPPEKSCALDLDRRRRASAAYRHVLRPRRFDRNLGAARSGRYAQHHRRLPQMLRGADHRRRRFRRQIYGRRSARLFWLSAGARARCGARRAGRSRNYRCGAQTGHAGWRAVACARLA